MQTGLAVGNGPSTDELLNSTSRTFALAIPLLPEPARTTVKLAYLLLRVADTLEDAEQWPRTQRMQALSDFCALLEQPSLERADALRRQWLEGGTPPTQHENYLELIGALPLLIEEVQAMDRDVIAIVLVHVLKTSRGMREILGSAGDDGQVRLETLEDLKSYCYIVAGIVGELLTAVFVHDCPALAAVQVVLQENQVAFGEGLQLVNILKDENTDLEEGRSYLPPNVPRQNVLSLARRDLRQAELYIAALMSGGAPAGFVAFTTLAWRLADASLMVLQSQGAGAKLSRPEVMRLLTIAQASVERASL
jgi:farnesyl-diphosphate farnesyltransferase